MTLVFICQYLDSNVIAAEPSPNFFGLALRFMFLQFDASRVRFDSRCHVKKLRLGLLLVDPSMNFLWKPPELRDIRQVQVSRSKSHPTS